MLLSNIVRVTATNPRSWVHALDIILHPGVAEPFDKLVARVGKILERV